jgi:hypothetical protein
MSRFNALDPKRDSFAGSVTETSEQTRLGAFLAVVVLPTCVAAYSALYFIQFYYGFGGGSPALYSVTQSETLQYGTQVSKIPINHLRFRLPVCLARVTKSTRCCLVTLVCPYDTDTFFFIVSGKRARHRVHQPQRVLLQDSHGRRHDVPERRERPGDTDQRLL